MSKSSSSSSDRISQQTVLRIEPSNWDNNNSAPALIRTKDLERKNEPITITRTDETKISTNKVKYCAIFFLSSTNVLQVYPQVDATKPEFQQTKSLDFDAKGKNGNLKKSFFLFFSCFSSHTFHVF